MKYGYLESNQGCYLDSACKYSNYICLLIFDDRYPKTLFYLVVVTSQKTQTGDTTGLDGLKVEDYAPLLISKASSFRKYFHSGIILEIRIDLMHTTLTCGSCGGRLLSINTNRFPF